MEKSDLLEKWKFNWPLMDVIIGGRSSIDLPEMRVNTDEEAEAVALPVIASSRLRNEKLHAWLERKPVQFTILTVLAVSIGGLIQIVPMLIVKSNIATITSVKPYTPLELEGRDLYIREGCNNCHSQLVRHLAP